MSRVEKMNAIAREHDQRAEHLRNAIGVLRRCLRDLPLSTAENEALTMSISVLRADAEQEEARAIVARTDATFLAWVQS